MINEKDNERKKVLRRIFTTNAQQIVASTWLGDHQVRPSALAIHRFTVIDRWRVTSREMIIIIIIILVVSEFVN